MNFGPWFFLGSLVTIALTAVLCAKSRAHRAYLAGVAILTAIGTLLAFASLPPHHSRLGGALFVVVMYAPLGVLYAFVPGYLVRRGASRREILFTTFIMTLVGIPIWIGYALYVSCYTGHDCL